MPACMFQLFLSPAITLPKVHLGQKLLTKQAFLTLPAFQYRVAASACLGWHINKVALIRTFQQPHTVAMYITKFFPATEVWNMFLCPSVQGHQNLLHGLTAAAALTKPGGSE